MLWGPYNLAWFCFREEKSGAPASWVCSVGRGANAFAWASASDASLKFFTFVQPRVWSTSTLAFVSSAKCVQVYKTSSRGSAQSAVASSVLQIVSAANDLIFVVFMVPLSALNKAFEKVSHETYVSQ